MAYIYLLELIVDDLSIFANGGKSPNNGTEEMARGELCVQLQFGCLVRCEVCEKDFGSALDLVVHKAGEHCLFVYHLAGEFGEEPKLRVSAHEKCAGGVKKLLGYWEESGWKIITYLTRSYEELNGVSKSGESSRESLRSCCSDRSQVPRRPVSHTWKTMYPLTKCRETGDTETVGYVIVTIRMSCLGPNVNQKVLFGKRDQRETPTTCLKVEDEPTVRCFTMENDPDDAQPVAPKASLASVDKEPMELQGAQLYDEYAAELNSNAICIRVEKDANIAVNIDGEGGGANGCPKGCWTSLTVPDGVYGLKEEFVHRMTNACKLPVVRGTLKYPAYHWAGEFLIAKKKTAVTIEDFRKMPAPARTVGMQACGPDDQLAGIEVDRKPWDDPNVDVFVLKLGKRPEGGTGSGNPRHQIEIEMRTPKGPSREIRPKETRGVQVLEEEFPCGAQPVPPSTPAASGPTTNAGNGGVKGKKPAKPAGKKGKKK